jgi:hypothetical protein
MIEPLAQLAVQGKHLAGTVGAFSRDHHLPPGVGGGLGDAGGVGKGKLRIDGQADVGQVQGDRAPGWQ